MIFLQNRTVGRFATGKRYIFATGNFPESVKIHEYSLHANISCFTVFFQTLTKKCQELSVWKACPLLLICFSIAWLWLFRSQAVAHEAVTHHGLHGSIDPELETSGLWTGSRIEAALCDNGYTLLNCKNEQKKCLEDDIKRSEKNSILN